MKIITPDFEIITPIDGIEILKIIEQAGRTCYKSENKITNDSCVKFTENIIKCGHESVLEHFNITVRIKTDRGVLHELVRHRLASYSQESTRYCSYNSDKFNNEITYMDIMGGMNLDSKVNKSKEVKNALYDEWKQACQDAERHYNRMIELGATPQIARSVLNNSTKTEIVVTANIREWRHIFSLRCSPAAHPQMRQIMIPLLKHFYCSFPVLFDDIYKQVSDAEYIKQEEMLG